MQATSLRSHYALCRCDSELQVGQLGEIAIRRQKEALDVGHLNAESLVDLIRWLHRIELCNLSREISLVRNSLEWSLDL